MKTLIRSFANLYAKNYQQQGKIKIQIVGLGSGYDTTFWNLYDELRDTHDIYFVETDFHDVVLQKSKIIASQEILRKSLDGNAVFEKGNYYIVITDLFQMVPYTVIIIASFLAIFEI